MRALRRFFALQPAPRRWPFAIRASICMGAPVLAGVMTGHVNEGLMAMLGGFTALYGNARPFAYRAVMLALVAAGFAVAVAIGDMASSSHGAAIVAVTAIAMVATYLCRVLETGPPGAYLFVLACAVGTAMPAGLVPWQIALLVGAGGAFAWTAHMVGVFYGLRGPEKTAVLRAVQATAAFVRALGTPAEDEARHRAAIALHDAWSALMTWQPRLGKGQGTLPRLRAINRELHLRFMDVVACGNRGEPAPRDALGNLKRIAERVRNLHAEPEAPSASYPLGRFRAAEALRESLRPGSMALLVTVRVGVAAALAGVAGMTLGLEHVYWSIAAAVLVLHYGYDWRRTVNRGLQRLVGTWLGLAVAALVLAMHPRGLGLVFAVMALQFIVEILVLRNYALAVVFITAIALLMVSAGHASVDIAELLLARGIDTTVGCAVGIAVFALIRTPVEGRLRQAFAALLDGLAPVIDRVRLGEVASDDASKVRRELQHRVFVLGEAYDAAVGGSAAERRLAEMHWPDVAAAQRLAYDALAMCWNLERGRPPAPGDIEALVDEEKRLRQALGG